MSDTKEFSRSSGNLKFGVRADVPVDPRATGTLSPAVESTAVIEHPRNQLVREIHTHERVHYLLRHWLMLVLGVSIGVGLVIASQVKSNIEQVATTAPAAAIQVTVVDPNADAVAVVRPETAAKAQTTSMTSAAVEEPSNIIQHAQNRPVRLEDRKFLFTAGAGMRSYEPEFVSSDANGQFDFRQGEAPKQLTLRPLNDSTGRYEMSDSSIQWQGAWKADNPAENVRLGDAYLKYIDQNFGSSASSNLSSISKGPSSLLGKMPRPAQQPSALKSYSGK
jgi:hypothetical protein